jgi:aerobic carbon-monoxide dehydrogenase medium subunit
VRAQAAEQSLIGAAVGQPLPSQRLPEHHPFQRAGRIAAERDADPRAEPYADVEYRRQVIAVLVARALRQASEDGRAHAGHHRSGRSRP